MGLFERIKGWLTEGESAILTENKDQQTGGASRFTSGFTWPWKKIAIFADGRLPQGWMWTSDGKLIMPGIYDATMGDALRVLPMYSLNISKTQSQVFEANFGNFRELIIGNSRYTVASKGIPAISANIWKWKRITATLSAGAATNQELVAAVSGKKIQMVLIAMGVSTLVDNIAPCSISATIHDADGTALSGNNVIAIPAYLYDLTNGKFFGNPYVHLGWMNAVCYSGTANKAIQADFAGGNGAEQVWLDFAYREF